MADESSTIPGSLVNYALTDDPNGPEGLGTVESYADGIYTIKAEDETTVEVAADKVWKRLQVGMMMNKSGHGFRS
ncbi:hypothetical protein TWF281_000613 [Arthrobotrys megalospora]